VGRGCLRRVYHRHARGIVSLRSRTDGTFATASSDGVVCYWSAAQLQRPIDQQVVVAPGEHGKSGQPVRFCTPKWDQHYWSVARIAAPQWPGAVASPGAGRFLDKARMTC
jgi:hypothetical protein